jgi:hypothetical protein
MVELGRGGFVLLARACLDAWHSLVEHQPYGASLGAGYLARVLGDRDPAASYASEASASPAR